MELNTDKCIRFVVVWPLLMGCSRDENFMFNTWHNSMLYAFEYCLWHLCLDVFEMICQQVFLTFLMLQPENSRGTSSVPWLLMPWPLASPDHGNDYAE